MLQLCTPDPFNATQFPLVASGLAVAYNLPNVTQQLVLNGYC